MAALNDQVALEPVAFERPGAEHARREAVLRAEPFEQRERRRDLRDRGGMHREVGGLRDEDRAVARHREDSLVGTDGASGEFLERGLDDLGTGRAGRVREEGRREGEQGDGRCTNGRRVPCPAGTPSIGIDRRAPRFRCPVRVARNFHATPSSVRRAARSAAVRSGATPVPRTMHVVVEVSAVVRPRRSRP